MAQSTSLGIQYLPDHVFEPVTFQFSLQSFGKVTIIK